MALQAARERGAELTDVMRILAVGFLCTSPGGVAEQVHAYRTREVRAECAQLQADRVADAFFEFWVPRRAARHRDRKASRVADHGTAGPVAESNAWKREPVDLARYEGGLVVTVLPDHESEPGQGWCVSVQTPQTLLRRQPGNERVSNVCDGRAGCDCAAGFVEASDEHCDVSYVSSFGRSMRRSAAAQTACALAQHCLVAARSNTRQLREANQRQYPHHDGSHAQRLVA